MRKQFLLGQITSSARWFAVLKGMKNCPMISVRNQWMKFVDRRRGITKNSEMALRIESVISIVESLYAL